MREVAVHWFRRDLRLDDHRALAEAAAGGGGVVPLFVVDPRVLGRPDTGAARVHFLARALESLAADLRAAGSGLVVRTGDAREVVPALAAEVGAGRVTAVRDAEPFARARDAAVADRLQRAGRRLLLTDEQWLTAVPEEPPTQVYGAFRRRFEARLATAGRGAPAAPATRSLWPAASLPPSDPLPDPSALAGPLAGEIPAAGEPAARRRLDRFVERHLAGYPLERDRPGVDATSRLSVDLRFGTISVRRVLAAVAERPGAEAFVRELAWRDFYATVLWQNPDLETCAHRRELEGVAWDDAPERLAAWREGRTGYPLVDAAMRQLRAEHWMHNRARMVVASFLCKDLHVDWREGERHFMSELVDGDLASNNGGWQWSASTGTDPQPYFRIFNPELQRARFDADGEYVRRWVPELGTAAYPKPIVDHQVERRRALRDYGRAAGRG